MKLRQGGFLDGMKLLSEVILKLVKLLFRAFAKVVEVLLGFVRTVLQFALIGIGLGGECVFGVGTEMGDG